MRRRLNWYLFVGESAHKYCKAVKYRFLLLILLHIFFGCSSPRYKSNISSGIDQQIVYERGMDLGALILERIEQAERGLEVRIPVDEINQAYRPLQKWIAGIKDTDGEVRDRKKVIDKYPVLQREGAPDDLAKIRNKIADKTEGIFNATARNRRLHFAKRFNLVLREEKQNLLFVFLPRGNLAK